MWRRFVVVEIRVSKIPELCFYLNFHESKWLNEYNLKPKFYLRYVDDILAAFDNLD